jgi:hypothetical protein
VWRYKVPAKASFLMRLKMQLFYPLKARLVIQPRLLGETAVLIPLLFIVLIFNT